MTESAPQTQRLRLRCLTLEDQQGLLEVFADPYARRFYPDMADTEAICGWIRWNLRNYQEYGFGLWAVELKPSGELIGDCGLTYQKVEGRRELEIGYHIHLAQRRKGYALEAARACLDHGFRHTDAGRICSIVRADNPASRAVASRLHADCREFVKDGRPELLFFTERDVWESESVHS